MRLPAFWSVFISLVCASFVAPGCSRDSQPQTGVGAPSPRLTGKSLDGEYVALSDYEGKVVLLNVWATWCPPCRAELPLLSSLHTQYADQGFAVLAVNIDAERSHGQVRQLDSQLDLSFPIVLDPLATVVGAFGVEVYPTSILIGRDQTVLWRKIGQLREGDRELTDHLERALAVRQ
jgi:thiol-disulfide isomerase/thioredoxin